MARPSPFDNLDHDQVKKLALAGWTDAQMADFFGVTEQTWNNWKKAHPKFFESLKEWKVEADHKVERSLYERAVGYEHPEVKLFKTSDDEIISEDVVKHYAPDTTAAIFWLKNRKPAEWRDKTDHELSTKGDKPLKWETTYVTADVDKGNSPRKENEDEK